MISDSAIPPTTTVTGRWSLVRARDAAAGAGAVSAHHPERGPARNLRLPRRGRLRRPRARRASARNEGARVSGPWGVPKISRTTHRNPHFLPRAALGDAPTEAEPAHRAAHVQRRDPSPERAPGGRRGVQRGGRGVPASQGGRHVLPERNFRRRRRRRFGVTCSRADPRRRTRTNARPCRPHRENATRRKPSRTCSWVRAPARRVPHHPRLTVARLFSHLVGLT